MIHFGVHTPRVYELSPDRHDAAALCSQCLGFLLDVDRNGVLLVDDGKLMKNGARIPLQVKPGDRVVFTSYGGDEFKLGDREVVLMREEDILAILE